MGKTRTTENLVQMIYGNRFPKFCRPYLRLRASMDTFRDQTAEQIGLTSENTAEMERKLRLNEMPLIQRDIPTWTGRYGIEDGQSHLRLESERIADLNQWTYSRDCETALTKLLT